jgi:hypothetical protein
MGRTRGYYPKLRQILLYPGAFVVDRPAPLPGGVQLEQRRALAGESWSQGQVILSWQDVLQGSLDPLDGRNVVVHEFAHQLDQVKGQANGAPPLTDRFAQKRWTQVMQAEFDQLRQTLAQGGSSLLDPYAASEPAEFFAVASEHFFEQGALLAQQHPRPYRELAGFYGVDSAAWAA